MPCNSNISGNHRAYEFAKHALTQPNMQFYTSIVTSKVRSLIKSKVDNQFHQLWKNNPKGLYNDKNATNKNVRSVDEMTKSEIYTNTVIVMRGDEYQQLNYCKMTSLHV